VEPGAWRRGCCLLAASTPAIVLTPPAPTCATAAAAAPAGIPIKQLNLVEDRSDYYKHRHQGEHGWAVAGAWSGGAGAALQGSRWLEVGRTATLQVQR
jgi:hypothetical protein